MTRSHMKNVGPRFSLASAKAATTKLKLGPTILFTWVLAAAWLAMGTAALGAKRDVSLHVTPRVAGAPAVVIITVTVEPHADNRALVVQDDSGEYYRSSEVSLEGDKAASRHTFTYRGLPQGEHQISAFVRGTHGVRGIAHTSVTVTGLGSP